MVRRFLCPFLYFASMATGAGCFIALPRLEPPVGDDLQLPPSVAVRIDDPKYLLQGAVCSSRILEGAVEPGLEPRPAIPELSPLEMVLFLSAELDVTPGLKPKRPVPLRQLEEQRLKEYQKIVPKNELDPVELHARIYKQVRHGPYLVHLAAYARPDPGDVAEYLPALCTALRDPSPKQRAMAAIGLGNFGTLATEALPALQQAINDENPFVQIYAAQSLGKIEGHGNGTLAALSRMLSHPEPEVVNLAAQLLGEIGPPAAPTVPALRAVLVNENACVRAQAMFALGKIGPAARAAIPDLCNALIDPRNEAEVEVVVVSMKGNDISFRSRNRSVRSYAAVALGEIGPEAKAALAALRSHLGHSRRPEDVAAAEYALQKIQQP